MNLSRFQTEQKPFGSGTFANVYKAFDTLENHDVFLRVIQPMKTEEIENYLLRDAEMMKSLNHPNILKCYGGFYENEKIYVVMEFSDGIDFNSFLKTAKFPLSESIVISFFSQIVSALSYAHSYNFVHQNLKPANIFLTKDDVLKICDFSSLKIFESPCLDDSCQFKSLNYIPPEVIFEQNFSFATDVWSLGCIIYELMTRQPPFYHHNESLIKEQILKKKPGSIQGEYSSVLKEIVMKMLEKNPNERITINEIKKALSINHVNFVESVHIPCSRKTEADLYPFKEKLDRFEQWIFISEDIDKNSLELKINPDKTIFITLEKKTTDIFQTHNSDAEFKDNKMTKSVIIFHQLNCLAAYSFYKYSILQSITFPNSLNSFGDHCFAGCSSLQSITFPNSLNSFGDHCFAACSSLQSISFPNNLISFGENCFSNCSSLQSIAFPNTIDFFGNCLFIGCSSLQTISLPNALVSLGFGCFSHCSSLQSISLPDTITFLGDECFNHCSSFKSISLPNTLTSLGKGCFSQCSSLESIYLPDTLISLGIYCFSECISLKSISLPNTLTSLGKSCFYQCISLESIELPSSLIKIPENCFYNCQSLKYVFIPKSIESIWSNSFCGCDQLFPRADFNNLNIKIEIGSRFVIKKIQKCHRNDIVGTEITP